jgi:endonuclease/exonuclease/phosphatase (EEP) superfamily protein YafD
MKIISWNLLHFAGATVDEIETLIEDERPDLLLMQEATRRIDLLPARLGGYYARHTLPGRRHGLAAWSPSPFRTAPWSFKLQPGLIVRRVCQILGLSGFTVANVHLSHGQMLNRRQLGLIFDNLPSRAAVLGDCNMVGPFLQNRFRDVGPRIATHFVGTVLPLRLDRCFIRNLDCTEVHVLAKGGSDHYPIMVRLSVPQPRDCDDHVGLRSFRPSIKWFAAAKMAFGTTVRRDSNI